MPMRGVELCCVDNFLLLWRQVTISLLKDILCYNMMMATPSPFQWTTSQEVLHLWMRGDSESHTRSGFDIQLQGWLGGPKPEGKEIGNTNGRKQHFRNFTAILVTMVLECPKSIWLWNLDPQPAAGMINFEWSLVINLHIRIFNEHFS